MVSIILLVSAARIALNKVVWPIKKGVPDNDPMDEQGHGTHVAGIIAGKNDW
jgi:subtilisin family serine protease